MKKILLLVLLLLVVSGGLFAYRILNPKQKDLDVVISDQDISSLEQKLSVEIPDIEKINANEETITITEYAYQEVELNNAEASLLMNLALSSVIPCSDVQAVCHDGSIEVSAMIKLSEQMIETAGIPAGMLPEKIAGFLNMDVQDNRISVSGISLNGIPVPQQLKDQLNQSVSDVLTDHGFEEVSVYEGRMVVKGNLPSRFE